MSEEQKPDVNVEPLPPTLARLWIAAEEAYQKLVLVIEQERAKPPPKLEEG